MAGAPLLVSIHDVAPATRRAAQRWAAHLDEREVPVTILAIPGPWRDRSLEHDPATLEWLWLRQAGGDEVALHGWSHRAPQRTADEDRTLWSAVGRGVARGAEEFWALDHREAAARIRRGLAVLRGADLDVTGFTPPGWLLGRGLRHAVATCGIRYVADHRGYTDLGTGEELRALALSHRAGGVGERAGALALGAIVRRRVRSGRPVRIALHPADLERPRLAAIALDAIDHALSAGAVPTTAAGAIARAVTRR